MHYQLSSALFTNANVNNVYEIKKLSFEIYNKIYNEYISAMGDYNFEYISDRNENLVFATIQQFLSYGHGPTKTIVDRARVLRENYGMEVIILNTSEQGGGEGIPLINGNIPNYNENLSGAETVEYLGEQYPFVQFDNTMPNISDSMVLFDFVKKYKPKFIMNIGGGSLAVDACSKLVPVLNVNTVPSDITTTKSTVQVTSAELSDEKKELLKILGKTPEDVIIGRFTWSLKEQTHHFTKQELGILDNTFNIAVIGVRLSEEIDDKFIHMIEPVLQKGACLVIIGEMTTYENYCNKYPVFKENSVYLGIQEDVLACLECCDLYVNPERTGGGTSVIEAMSKGLPAVTLSRGDVALGAGSDFCVSDYDEMQNTVIKYMTDKEFYEEMQKKALARAEYMLDSNGAFSEIIDEFIRKN
jgi:hypothetical protein